MTRNPLRILVTGAGGLLGSELSGALAERSHAVVAMLHRSTAMHRNDPRPPRDFSLLQRDPWFQDANLRALSGRTCPRPDQAFLQRLIDYGIATGYLRGRTVQRTSG